MKLSRFQNFYLDGETLVHHNIRTYILHVIWSIKERKIEWSSDRVAISVFIKEPLKHTVIPQKTSAIISVPTYSKIKSCI